MLVGFLSAVEIAPTRFIPEDLRERVWQEARSYINTPYLLGGENRKGIDCSGLVINCYRQALENTKYELLFGDVDALDMRWGYSIKTHNPQKGDLVFIGRSEVTHIGIIEKIEDDKLYFIHASSKNQKVEYVAYRLKSKYIQGYGKMIVRLKKGASETNE